GPVSHNSVLIQRPEPPAETPPRPRARDNPRPRGNRTVNPSTPTGVLQPRSSGRRGQWTRPCLQRQRRWGRTYTPVGPVRAGSWLRNLPGQIDRRPRCAVPVEPVPGGPKTLVHPRYLRVAGVLE